jgi:acyl-CoA synthetase (AMP-forming)/AMP-acid ligase II
MNLGDIPRRNAYRHGARRALATPTESLSWADINARANRLANHLLACGMKKGDRLAVLCVPCAEVVIAYFAAAKAGLVVVPIHTGLVEREVAFMLGDVGARALLVDGERLAAMGGAFKSTTTLENVLAISGGPEANEIGAQNLDAVLRDGDARELAARPDESDLFAIRFTSGTTGLPKGCPSTHQDWLRRSFNFLAHINHSSEDRALLMSPLSLGVGSSMLMSYSIVGAQMHMFPRFDAQEALACIAREKISTFMIPVPSLFARLLEADKATPFDLSSLRVVGYGGAVFPIPLLLETLKRFRCGFFGVYGHLEAGGFSTYLTPEDHRLEGESDAARERKLARLRSCGREALQADVRVALEDGTPAPTGEVGELLVRTDGMISDYWNRPGEIEKSIRQGWFHTGDAAYVDEDRYIYIADRIKDVIRTGGMNVSSIEVENVVLEAQGVREAAAIGLPDPRWGEMIAVCVVAEGAQAACEQAIMDLCRARLANYKTPKRIIFVDAIPKNSMGKALKRELKAQFTSGTTS